MRRPVYSITLSGQASSTSGARPLLRCPGSQKRVARKKGLQFKQRRLLRGRPYVEVSQSVTSFTPNTIHLVMQPYAVTSVGTVYKKALLGVINGHMENQVYNCHLVFSPDQVESNQERSQRHTKGTPIVSGQG
jgi:hypothetical protein